jgi:catechol 2,3-dioxygenase-like lactoylglutathione lyase family enzyme
VAVSPAPLVQRLARFSLTTADAEQLAAFYENTFGCHRLSTQYISGAAFENLMGVKGGALQITLSLGEQIVELLQFDQQGRPYPQNRSASDLIFQHLAIVVSDMAQAYRRLSAIEGWMAISCGGPQLLPESSGGVTAFKFRDPEGHPLEFLSFPKAAMPARWRERQNDELCLGIDHSAISVSDTARSVSFYESLGLQMSSQSSNHGEAQEKLDDLAGVRVEVTAFEPKWPDPHLELLCYRANARIGELRSVNPDIAVTRLLFKAPTHLAPRDVVDPDGHHLVIGG